MLLLRVRLIQVQQAPLLEPGRTPFEFHAMSVLSEMSLTQRQPTCRSTRPSSIPTKYRRC